MNEEEFAEFLATQVHRGIEAVAGPLRAEVERLKGIVGELNDTMVEDRGPMLRDAVAKAFAELPVPKDGASVTVDDVTPLIVAEVEKQVASIPRPKDGTSITVEDVEAIIGVAVEKGVARIPVQEGRGIASAVIDAEGKLILRFTDGEEATVGVVVGKSADPMAILRQVTDNLPPPPPPGRDGVATREELTALVDEKVGATVATAVATQVEKAVALLPRWEYKGVWRPETTYTKGNGASFGNEMWMCMADETTQTPGTGKDWQLAVRKGRDGDRGKRI